MGNNPGNWGDPSGEIVGVLFGLGVSTALGVGATIYLQSDSGKQAIRNLANKAKEAIDNLVIGPWPGSGDQAKPEPWPAPDDWRGQCIRLFVMCDAEQWSGKCGDCLLKCTAQHEWPYHDCSPDKKCKR